MKKIIVFIFLLLSSFFYAVPAYSQNADGQNSSVYEAEVSKIINQEDQQGDPEGRIVQELELIISEGSRKSEIIYVTNGSVPVISAQLYKPGDKVLVTMTQGLEGDEIYYISDYVRKDWLFRLFGVFVLVTVIIAGWRGVTSLIGMAISFGVIFTYILPEISKGANPVEVAIIGSVLIIPVTFFLSHGINLKTSVAVAGTIISLVITGLLSGLFVNLVRLTGFASEEAAFLQFAKSGEMNMQGLLLAGIIIGVLGVLDDITVSQSAIVFQLKKANNKLGFKNLYKRSMDVGRDHISSMVNTLVLVYTGASLPLLIMFTDSSRSISEVVNYEIIADEIVRTLVGSIGLIIAVPITTLIAAVVVEKAWHKHI